MDNIDLRIQISNEDETEESFTDSNGSEDESSAISRPHSEMPRVVYDTSLPAQHSYLGTDFNELSGRTLLDDGSFMKIRILPLPGVMLVPGQTLPLQIHNRSIISKMMDIINGERVFGLVNSRISGRTFQYDIDVFGTIAEIRSYRDEDYESINSLTSVLRIKAEGRQRFEIIESSRSTETEAMFLAKVRILPDLYILDPGRGCRLPSLDKFRSPLNDTQISESSSSNCKLLLHRASHKKNRFDFANYTALPEFVYKMYDPHILMERILQLLRSWNNSLLGDFTPCEPKEFSYWIAANLPLDDRQRRELLKINEVTQRLQRGLKILEECSVLACRDCQRILSGRKNIFSMSRQGPLGTYVNTNGYVHETITVYSAHGLRYVGRPSTEQSWFPGYAWTIVECANCQSHVGWNFTSIKSKQSPEKFWALCRSSIINRISSSDTSSIAPSPYAQFGRGAMD